MCVCLWREDRQKVWKKYQNLRLHWVFITVAKQQYFTWNLVFFIYSPEAQVVLINCKKMFLLLVSASPRKKKQWQHFLLLLLFPSMSNKCECHAESWFTSSQPPPVRGSSSDGSKLLPGGPNKPAHERSWSVQDQRAHGENKKGFCKRSWDVCGTMVGTYSHIPLHALLARPVIHFFLSLFLLPDWLEQGRNLARCCGCLGDIAKFSPKFTAVSQKVQIVRSLFTD